MRAHIQNALPQAQPDGVDLFFRLTAFDARMLSKNRVFLVLVVQFIGFGEMLGGISFRLLVKTGKAIRPKTVSKVVGKIGNLSIDDERHDDDFRYPRRIGSSKQCVA